MDCYFHLTILKKKLKFAQILSNLVYNTAGAKKKKFAQTSFKKEMTPLNVQETLFINYLHIK